MIIDGLVIIPLSNPYVLYLFQVLLWNGEIYSRQKLLCNRIKIWDLNFN